VVEAKIAELESAAAEEKRQVDQLSAALKAAHERERQCAATSLAHAGQAGRQAGCIWAELLITTLSSG
jgi:hypothetical protein